MRSGTHACMDGYFAHTVLRAGSLPSFGITMQFIRHARAEVLEVLAEHTLNISLKILLS
jgi:hypothetical protein